MSETSPAPTIDLFVHIPKTAGTTMTQVLQRNYRQTSTFYLGPNVQPKIEKFQRLTARQQRHFRLVVGHMSFGLHAYLAEPRPYRYFTMLREPIERVLSFYYFIKRTPDHYLYNPVATQNLSIPEFLAYQDSYMARNAQTRFLCGLDVMPYYGPLDEHALELAKTHIRDHIAVTGLTERFDESLVLFKRVFGWNQIYYTRENVTSNRRTQDDLSDDVLQAIRDYNVLDMELYAFAQQHFEQQIADYGSDFERDLATVHRQNRSARLWMPVEQAYRRARTFSVRTYLKELVGRPPQ